MNWAWTTSLDQLWRSPSLPMWVTLAAALFFALVLLVTLLRAEKSVANGALTVITLLAITIAVASTVRSFGDAETTADTRSPRPVASLPALSCLDDLAGDAVAAACERALFASADSAAAAVSYTAAQISRLTSFGDEATADKAMTSDLSALRRAVERDRYGLVAHVLVTRDGCTPSDCAVYKSLSDHNVIAANMSDRTYQNLIGRYALAWNTPGSAVPVATGVGTGAGMGLAGLPPSVPTGKPLSGDFPSSSSIPAVSIMAPESSTPAPPPRPAANAAAPKQPASIAAPRPAASPPNAAQAAVPRTAAAPSPAPPAAPKKQAPKKNAAAPQPAAPVPLAPAAASEDN
ncbi:hypothetical protein [Bradyrhizobium prioriisuperbiae]|uniref:hypothetical protein n=1 Tax=Bradyrhizobium prioriisuperbiae TaxID=2854389 RepID=UPI0028E48F21|nr:hypothetical protein [Bradyrhizobium prioritasuperba]